jgi:hypothetical protein
LALLLAVVPAAQAQLSFVTNADGVTATITQYSGGGVVNIPAATNGLTVTCIADYAFYETSLTGVTIPTSVTNIGQSAFLFCSSLTSVTIPGSVSVIGDYAFDSCSSLACATIASGVTSIGTGQFADCTSLAGVTIPGSVASIGDSAFNGCTSLTNATIGVGVGSVGEQAFAYCERLPGVTIPGTVASIGEQAFENCLKLAVVTVGAGVSNIGEAAFERCTSLAGVFFGGNAPTADSTVFTTGSGNNYDSATVYYLPGTTGWSNTFAVLPAVLWNPVIQTGDGNFGVQANHFGFDITGTANIPIVVEACSNLASPVWTSLQSLTLTNGLFYFSDPAPANASGSYYQIASP